MLTMALLGLGEIIGGGLVGFIRDKVGNRLAYFVQILLTIAGMASVLIVNDKNTYDYTSYLMCFVWGLQDSGLNCLVNCVLGFEFESKIIPFSLYKFV